ncbi:monovalent cation/H+ antiporter subunit E [Haloplanus aerogenes]|uniref:Monovalent cation/H+ antiporter subunit E n=1 Tax=Haloplanus aerogenes TaxID=660522 RepID=A0A3M0DWC0_9EURY|nr:monovalent cation/H+ antiporter subunit E [Haloplanus aerogenes]AZH25561.1 monovalent cation/H+ antiporter subunit E [Haloplanus aerogenes]RMB25277.1 multicomponent Na+:H+ antiporter subunit E [Haloplanus aerogenes]
MVADHGDVLVPVGDSETLRRTVAYAVEQAYESAAETGESVTIHFVYPARWRIFETDRDDITIANELLNRVVVWAEEDLDELVGEDAPKPVNVESATVGTSEYVFSPGDFADVISRYADANGVERIVVDPSFRPGGSVPILRSFEEELAQRGFDVFEAPVTRQTRRRLPFTDIGLPEFFLVYAVSFLFYLALGGWHVTDLYEVVTGAATAGVVTLTLSRVALKSELPDLRLIGMSLVRLAAYTPILLWEIAKANVALAYVVLHPRLPIDPRIVEFDAAVWGDMPVTTLANSITLTPGTLTIDVSRQHFLVHALIPEAEDDLLEGTLERLVRFVFYGRDSASIASPRERLDDGEEEN